MARRSSDKRRTMPTPITKNVRVWLCAMPQSGWGGTTLAGYTGSIAARPEVSANEDECRQVLEGLVAAGHAQSLGAGEDGLERWELNDGANEALTAAIEVDESTNAASVLLELQPGTANTNAGA
jgi:hypothetical protein